MEDMGPAPSLPSLPVPSGLNDGRNADASEWEVARTSILLLLGNKDLPNVSGIPGS